VCSRFPRHKEKNSEQYVAPTLADPPPPDANQQAQKRTKLNSPKSFYSPIDPDDALKIGNGRIWREMGIKHPEKLTPELAAKEASFARVKLVEYLRKHKKKYGELFQK
jgi:hypothetical protein